MFLLTFVLIIISVLGIYTQVYALEAARFMANQTSLAATLVTWHTTAANVAANAISPTAPGAAGCSLTPSDGVNGQCLASTNLTYKSNSHALVTGTYTNPSGITVGPPASLSSSIYQWKSIAFAPATGGYYVLTYVPAPAPASGPISTASNPSAQLNMTLSDLYRQLRLLGIPTYSFGYIANGTLNVAPITIPGVGITPISYTLPTSVVFTNGSLGIISSPGRCSSC